MQRDAAYFWEQAERARRFAAAAVQPDIRAAWIALAQQFDFLAEQSERDSPWRD